MKKVLIVVDMQNDFVTGVLGSSAAQAAVGPISRTLAEYRKEGWQVLYTADTHLQGEYDAQASLESVRIPRHCVKGETGWDIVPELLPLPNEPVVEKPSFGSLTLPVAICPLSSGDVVELCGVCTDICVKSNALLLRAHFPNNRIAVLKDCCAGTSEESHSAALSVMRSCLIDII